MARWFQERRIVSNGNGTIPACIDHSITILYAESIRFGLSDSSLERLFMSETKQIEWKSLELFFAKKQESYTTS